MSDDVITTFGIEQDTQSINKAFDTVSNLDDNIKKVGKSALQTADDISRISQVTQQIPGDSLATTASPLTKAVSEEGTDFGKVESGLRGVGGAVGALGGQAGQATESVIALVAEGPALIDNFKNLASGMSLMGGIAGGVLLAGITIATFAVSEFNKEAEETARVVNAAKEAQIAYNESLILTSDEIENTIASNEQQLEINRRNQEAVREAIDALDEPTDLLFQLGDGLGFVGDEGDKLADELKALEEEETELTNSTNGLTEALSSAEVAANDARQALLDEVDAQAELDRFRNRALQNTAEQNAELARQIEEERAIKQRQIATLKASGDTDKEVQDRIEELTGELQELDQQSAVLSSSAVKASEAQKEQAKAADELTSAAKEAAKAQDEIKKAERDRIKELQSGMMELAQLEAENRNAIIEERKAGLSQFKELIDKQFADSIAAEEKRQQELNKIAERGRKDALRQSEEFDFLGAFRTRQTTADQLEEAESAAAEQQRIQKQADAQERIALLQKINEELALKQAQFDAEVEQQAQELILKQIESQNEIDELRKTSNEKSRILQQSGNEEIKIANRIAQAQVDIAGQALQALNQLQQTAIQQVQSIQSQVTNIGQVSNTLLPNVTGNLSGALGNATVQQMQAMLNQFSQLTTQGF